MSTIALYGGGFKPPTKGHFGVIEKALKENPEIDEFITFVGAKERNGINQSESLLIWDIYSKYLPMKVEFSPSKRGPIGDIASFIKNHPDDKILFVIGAREDNQEDFDDIKSRTTPIVAKYPNVEVKIITTSDPTISGTNARKAVKASKEKLAQYLPTQLSDKEVEEVYNLLSPIVTEGSLTEGRYDQEVLKLSRFIVSKLRKEFNKEFKGNFENKFEDVDYTLNLTLTPITKDYAYLVDASSGYDELNIDVEYNLSYFPAEYNELIAELKEVLRHEFEHIAQLNFYKDAYPEGNSDDLPMFDYLMLDYEVAAGVQGLYKRSKTKKQSFTQVLDNFLDERSDELTDDEIKKIRQTYIDYAKKNLPKVRLNENIVTEEITKSQLDSIEDYADRLFAKLGIDIEFTRHFLDRVNDERNKKPITVPELIGMFKRLHKKHGKPLSKIDDDFEAVVKDFNNNINIPFAINVTPNDIDLVAKTIMRKKDFKTSTPVIALNENATYTKTIDLVQYLAELTQNMLDNGDNIEPLPNIEFINGDSENAGDFFGKTAYYDPSTKTIVLYTEGRHPKDIARSYAHEMIHHTQNLEGRLEGIGTTNTNEDDNLQDIEKEAYLNGNIKFRNWTDSLNENVSDNTYPFEVTDKSYDETDNSLITVEYEFDTPDNTYRVEFYSGEYSPEAKTFAASFGVSTGEFNALDTYQMTGEGNARKIFKTIINIIKDFTNKEDVNKIIIDGTSEKRKRIYKNIFSNISPKIEIVELDKPYKHKYGFNDKLGKDPFGLNQFAREIAEGVLNEGVYDSIVSKLSKEVLETWIEQFKQDPNTPTASLDKNYELKDAKGRPLDFLLSANIDFKKTEDGKYIVDGGADEGTDEDEGFITLNFQVDPRDIPEMWSTISMDIRDVLRHEIEHLTQGGYNVRPDKYIEDDQAIRTLIQKYELLPLKNYFLLDKEVDAMLQGMWFKAKKSKTQFKDVIDDYLNKVGLEPEEKEEIKDHWRKRNKALALPVFENEPQDGKAAPYGSGYNEVDEAKKKDPKVGTGKKPKGSSRRLYTDEDPTDTVKIKFSTRQDIVDTLNKTSFKNKSHARQSQIINLIHQRVRAAYNRAKDPDVKKRLKTALDYAEERKEASKKKTQRLKKQKLNEFVKSDFNRILFYQDYFTNVSPSTFNIDVVEDNIIISGINDPYPPGFNDVTDTRQTPVDTNLEEGDTIEKYSAKGKATGKLKQGTVRKRLNIPKGEKIPMYKINKELARLKKMDKDPNKKGAQLGDKNQKYYKALQLAKTLKTTTNVKE